jgi:nitrogen PTS system EIIA component
MQLDVHSAALALKVPLSTIFRWIDQKKLPATGVDGHYRFGRAELLEWATNNHLDVSYDALADDCQREHLLLAEALEAGGLFYDVPGTDKNEVLRSVTAQIPVPADCDRETLLQLFLARESIGSTAVGQGVAIPHPRHPVVLSVARPSLSLCFLAQPIDFGAPGRGPVHTLFVLLSPTVQLHLQLLARIATLLRDERFAEAIKTRQPRENILNEARRVEQTFEQIASSNGSQPPSNGSNH